MRLRGILMVLSILAFLSVSVGGGLYTAALRSDAIKEAERRVASRLDMVRKNRSSFLSENDKPVQTLAESAMEILALRVG
jgi:hypothetical protein